MKETLDQYDRLIRHKYMKKFKDLHNRIEIWMQVGPACTEYEWTKAEEALEDVDELIRLCTVDIEYKVPAYRMKYCNRYWKKYDKLRKIANE
jgi:hypothetical protein